MSATKRSPALHGIEVRHQKGCRNVGASDKATCRCCALSFRAAVYDKSLSAYRKSKWSKSLADVRAWRLEVQNAVVRGGLAAPSAATVEEAWRQWMAGVPQGTVRNRSGQPFKPSVIRSYATSMRLHVLPLVGSIKLADLKRRDVQAVIDRLVLEHSPSTVRNAINPLRVLCRYAEARDLITTNPTLRLDLPAARGARERTSTPAEAATLVAALPERDRALWATALYAGLRRGELQALRWDDIDLMSGTISVEHSYDAYEGLVAPKSLAGRRKLPIPGLLRAYLVAHRISSAPDLGTEHVFRRSTTDGRPFEVTGHATRARKAWRKAGVGSIGLHEARHAFGTFVWDSMVRAGRPNPKRLQKLMGHADIKTTMDRYVKDSLDSAMTAAADFDAYLSTVASD